MIVAEVDHRAGLVDGHPVRVDADEGLQGLYLPAGVAHGFYAERDL